MPRCAVSRSRSSSRTTSDPGRAPAPATGYLRDGRSVVGASIRDLIGGATLEVRARVVVNATGPWLDRSLAPLRPDGARPLLRLTKGTHLVVPRATEHAHVLFAKR